MKQNHENFTVTNDRDYKSLSVKAVWCTKVAEWLARQGLETWKHQQSAEENPQDRFSTADCTRRVQLSGNQTAADRVLRVAVEDLVVSQEVKPKKAPINSHRSAREISHETTILHSSVHRIIHHDLKLKSSNASNDTVLSCCLKPSLVSLADKQPYRLQ